MSNWVRPIVAPTNAVAAPTMATTSIALAERLKIGQERATMKMPAVTIVAAWMSAETGVGPSMASGSQTNSGSCADLPIAPVNRSRAIRVIVPCGSEPIFSKTVW